MKKYGSSVDLDAFMRDPKNALKNACDRPVAVLEGGRPSFFAVSPKLMAQIAELRDEAQLAILVGHRLESVRDAVPVSLDHL